MHTQQEMLPQQVDRLVLPVQVAREVRVAVVLQQQPQQEVREVPQLELEALPTLVVLLQTMERLELS
jgi:hypothetical protein